MEPFNMLHAEPVFVTGQLTDGGLLQYEPALF